MVPVHSPGRSHGVCHVFEVRFDSQCVSVMRGVVRARAGCSRTDVLRRLAKESARRARVVKEPVIEFAVTGLLAWRGGQPGQVGNEAATAVFHQCRGSGSSPLAFRIALFVQVSCCFSPHSPHSPFLGNVSQLPFVFLEPPGVVRYSVRFPSLPPLLREHARLHWRRGVADTISR